MRGRPQEVLCGAFLLYNGTCAIYGNHLILSLLQTNNIIARNYSPVTIELKIYFYTYDLLGLPTCMN